MGMGSWVVDMAPLARDTGEPVDFDAAERILLDLAFPDMQALSTRDFGLAYEGYSLTIGDAGWDGKPLLALQCSEGGRLRLPITQTTLAAAFVWLRESGAAQIRDRKEERAAVVAQTLAEEAATLRAYAARGESNGFTRQEALAAAAEFFIRANTPLEEDVVEDTIRGDGFRCLREALPGEDRELMERLGVAPTEAV